jgi:pilus assembly protein Flp/PilA
MMHKAIHLLGNLKADRKGVTALEYGVIAAVLVVAVAAGIGTIGGGLATKLTAISTAITGPAAPPAGQ